MILTMMGMNEKIISMMTMTMMMNAMKAKHCLSEAENRYNGRCIANVKRTAADMIDALLTGSGGPLK